MKFLCAFEMSESVQSVQVVTSLIRNGYRLVSQKQDDQNLIHVIAEAPSFMTQADIVEELGGFDGCTVVKLAFADEPKAKKKEKKSRLRRRKATILDVKDESSALTMIGEQYPRISPAVKAYGRSLSPLDKADSLQEIGRKVGAGVYQRDYSLGSPLKLVPALSRELRPALKEFCDVSGDEFELRLDENPFISTDIDQCTFKVHA